MIVKAVQEHSVQQMTLCTFGRVLERHEMAMMRRHAETELGRRPLFRWPTGAVGMRGLATPWRRTMGPIRGTHSSCGDMGHLLDKRLGFHTPGLEYRFDGGHTLLYGSDSIGNYMLVISMPDHAGG